VAPFEIVAALRRRLWLVIAGALIAGIVAAGFSFLWPPSYKAEALLLITKLRPEVSLDPSFQTAAEENIVNLSVQDDQVRRQTLVGLTQSPDLLAQVLDHLAGSLPAEERSIRYLAGVTDVRTQGNLIAFEAQTGSPQIAATIANTWAQVCTDYVNSVYGATSPTYEQLQEQLTSARATYEAAKRQVEDFVRQSQESELSRKIEQKSQILSDLQAGQLGAARQQVDGLLSRINQLDGLVLNSQALKAQLAGSPAATLLTPGEQFSLFSLETQAFTAGSAVSVTLQFDASWLTAGELTVEQAVEELDRLMDTLKASRNMAQTEVDRRSTALLEGKELLTYEPDGPATASIESLQAEINTLQAELNRQQLTKQDLVDARTLARDSYQTLARKAAEVEIQSNLIGVEVQLAAEAQVPEAPSFPRPLPTTALGILAGALAGVALALLLEAWPPKGAGV
jgi:succinoglycan biosynthesis transport protein ExoP